MYMTIAALVGTLITLMATFNSQLALHGGQIMSLLVFHLCGFLFISLLIPLIKERRRWEKAPLHLYCGGMIGVLVVFLNNVCFLNLGVSTTISMIVLGQSIASVLIDSTGLLNMEKHRFKKAKLLGLGIMLTGILIMVDEWQLDFVYITLALLTGFLVLLSIILTSQLGLKVGVFRATQINYLAGLVTICLVIVLLGFDLPGGMARLPGINPLFLVGGGVCGVLIVIGFNTVVPKIPAIYTTILMFLGQITAGLLIDFVLEGSLGSRLIAGCCIVGGGMVLNILIDKYGIALRPGMRTSKIHN